MTTIAPVETRRFSMHSKLLFDTISRQAGTLSKAILEGVMNAVDAQATYCKIELTSKQVIIEDDGGGFKTRQEIEQNFEVFGQPHEESEGKTYGTFRMGRGQLFAFGQNTWRSGAFKMLVDFKNHGIDYELIEGLKHSRGCRIYVKLYDEQLPSEMQETERDVKRMCKWIGIPVRLNGKVISTNPDTAKWDHVTPEAYIKLREVRGLQIYNLGAWVFELAGYHIGAGGEVVSRKQLKVNFARNTVQEDCPVWRKIKPFLKREARKRIARKPVLTDDERQRMSDLIVQGEEVPEMRRLKLFTDCTGQHWSLQQLQNKRGLSRISVADEGSIKGDRLMQAGAAFVFSTETLERFDVKDVDALRDLITDLAPRIHVTAVPFEELSKGISDKSYILHEHELTPKERAILTTMRHAGSVFLAARYEDNDDLHEVDTWRLQAGRTINIGKSDTKDGWTDGNTYIVVNRDFLRRSVGTTGTPNDWVRVGHLLLHEYCHQNDEDTKQVVHHTPEFYRDYHDRYEQVADFVGKAYKYFPTALEQVNKRLSKHLLKSQDHAAKAKKENQKMKEGIEQHKLDAAQAKRSKS